MPSPSSVAFVSTNNQHCPLSQSQFYSFAEDQSVDQLAARCDATFKEKSPSIPSSPATKALSLNKSSKDGQIWEAVQQYFLQTADCIRNPSEVCPKTHQALTIVKEHPTASTIGGGIAAALTCSPMGVFSSLTCGIATGLGLDRVLSDLPVTRYVDEPFKKNPWMGIAFSGLGSSTLCYAIGGAPLAPLCGAYAIYEADQHLTNGSYFKSTVGRLQNLTQEYPSGAVVGSAAFGTVSGILTSALCRDLFEDFSPYAIGGAVGIVSGILQDAAGGAMGLGAALVLDAGILLTSIGVKIFTRP